MAMKNKTQYALLGILSIAPGSGYDIKKYCDTVISNFWNENFGHIYPVLNTMEKEGLIKRLDDNISDRKKVYGITEKGKEEFINWLMEPAEYKPARSEFLLKFLFSSNLSHDRKSAMIEDYRKRHELRLDELIREENCLNQENEDITGERKEYLRVILRYGILGAEATIKWCDEVIHNLK